MTRCAALVLLLATAAAANYCTLPSCPGRTHTMCKYPRSNPGSSCDRVLERGVSRADRALILREHNRIRQAVKAGRYASKNLPAAKAMPDLRWDSELARVAQRWADQCLYGHDKCRSVPRFYVGQNFAFTSGAARDWNGRAIRQWFHSELPFFRQSDLVFRRGTDPATGRAIGHLTQVIWARTTKIGCGYMAWGNDKWAARTYFCNYGPGGNIRHHKIYQRGQSPGTCRG
ncbi:venom allergen 5-like [Pollicipes pollicipes]|uniref:venom allergen 5-like n=1 Tax=Pollicipes pollicipes TaxID=41117 RepID=UPI001884ADF7|nr:venom allergen 5-like [Pollicipes pollicipes]